MCVCVMCDVCLCVCVVQVVYTGVFAGLAFPYGQKRWRYSTAVRLSMGPKLTNWNVDQCTSLVSSLLHYLSSILQRLRTARLHTNR